MKLINNELCSEAQVQTWMVTMIIRRRIPRMYAARKSVREWIRLRPSGNHPEQPKRLGS